MLIGDLKSLHLLWVNLARNRRYSTFISNMDIETFTGRVENEGLTFLTTTLPTLGKALDTFHSSQQWHAPDQFKTDSDGIPHFMGQAIRFALEGDSKAVDCVRQLSFVFYKLEVDYPDDLVDQFLVDFKRVDEELVSAIDLGDRKTLEIIARMKRMIERLLCNTDPLDIRPSHGSGATACHTKNEDKWHQLRYYPKLDTVFSYSEYFFYSPSHLLDRMDLLEGAIESFPRARICLVPKDSRGPRVISCEPAELMFIQQGLMRSLYGVMEDHYLTGGQVNFTDQTINRALALRGSIDSSVATLDLSEASDRVSLQLVRLVFPPRWVEALEACRSEETELPSGEVIKLNKFAPMGSSCCFPVEALCFWACVQAIISMHLEGKRSPKVYVYGDDIIVPTMFAETAIEGLELIGLKVNRQKSFTSGPFRESCGGEYHRGYDVTPVKVRKVPSSSNTGLTTSADLCNEFIAKFGAEDVQRLIQAIEEIIGIPLPRTELAYPGTLRIPPSASNDVFYQRRWNNQYQRFEYRISTLTSTALARHLPDWEELLRKELQSGSYVKHPYWGDLLTEVSKESLDPGWYTEPHSVRQKWAWVWLG